MLSVKSNDIATQEDDEFVLPAVTLSAYMCVIYKFSRTKRVTVCIFCQALR